MKNKHNHAVSYLTRGAMIAALYVALTYLSAIFGLSSGAIQFRLSEALTILPILMPEAIPGLFVGCILSNILTGCALWDIIFGSVATLIGCIGTRLLKNIPRKFKWFATLPPILSNAVIVPFVLIYTYGSPDSYIFLSATVALGEIVCAGVLGSLLYFSLSKHSLFLR